MSSYKKITIFITILLLIFTLLIVSIAHAHEVPDQVCDNGVHTHNPHCEEVIPSTTPSITPSETPETPEATPSATPTVTTPPAGHGDNMSDGKHTDPDGLGCAVHECPSPFDGSRVGWK